MNECINEKTKTETTTEAILPAPHTHTQAYPHTQIQYHSATVTPNISQILSRAYCLIFIHKHVAAVFLEGKEVENNRYVFALKEPQSKTEVLEQRAAFS